MNTVHDVNDRRLDFYRDLRYAQTLHTSSKVFLTDGEKITLSVLQSSLNVRSILLTQELYEKHLPSIQSKMSEDACYVMSKRDMDILIGFDLHSPMMSIVEEPVSTPFSSMKGPIIALNGIVNSDNVGGIIRNAVGLGFESIITDSTTSSPYLRRSVRVSMGTVAFAACSTSKNLCKDLLMLKNERSIPIISAEITPISKNVSSYKFPHDFILVFGSEGHGISHDILAISDEIVHIPMFNMVNSLNVSSSSAIILHAAKVQKG